jgi:hypothetical protein
MNAGYHNKTYLREAVLELSYPLPAREPDLSLPVSDLPSAEASPLEEPPLPPVSAPPESPSGALNEFWGSGSGAL